MPYKHTVVQGECLSIIAKRHGFLWKTLWNDPLNAELKSSRKNPDILFPGDTIYIPDKVTREEPGATEQKHVFKLKIEIVDLNLRMMREDESRPDIEFTLTVDKGTFKQSKPKTDADGWIREKLPPEAEKAKLTLKPPGADPEEYELLLGHLDPIDKDPGVAVRLKNLGYFFDLDEDEDQAMEYGLKGFQGKNTLPETGEKDAETLERLKQKYGS